MEIFAISINQSISFISGNAAHRKREHKADRYWQTNNKNKRHRKFTDDSKENAKPHILAPNRHKKL